MIRLRRTPPLPLPKSIPTKKGRWEFLDAIRGIAALLVVVQHTTERYPRVWNFYSRYVNLGELGVVTFFLVSGYIIPVSLERYGSVSRFWIARAFRLLPMYWVSLAVAVLLEHQHGGFRYWLGNLTMTQGLFKVPYALGTYWTLSYEVVFYILCTIIFGFALQKLSHVWAIGGASLLLAGNVGCGILFHRALSAEKLGVVVTAFIGTLIYRHSAGMGRRIHLVIALTVMACAVVVADWLRLGVYANVGQHPPMGPLSGDLSFFLGYGLFGAIYLCRYHIFPVFVTWLGRISYSVYLAHGLVLLLIPPIVSSWCDAIVVTGVTLLLSSFTYRFIEDPAIAWHHRWSSHRAGRLKRVTEFDEVRAEKACVARESNSM